MKEFVRKKKISVLIALITGILVLGTLFFVSPSNAAVIFGYIVAVGIFFAALFSLFFDGKRTGLFAAGISVFLALSAFIGFDIVQTILLLLVIIGVDRLIHQTS